MKLHFVGKNTYLSSFVSGLAGPVSAAISSDLPRVKVAVLLDGLVLYETSAPLESIRGISYLNNTFHVVRVFKEISANETDAMMAAVLDDRDLSSDLAQQSSRARTFRVIASEENKLVSANRAVLKRLEAVIAAATGLRVNRSKPDVEFWFLTRSEGYGFFARRLTRRTATERDLERGELRPELASILCRISDPTPDDVFLDPFCGSGAIPLQRATAPFQRIFASDVDPAKVQRLRKRVRGLATKCNRAGDIIASCEDARALTRIETGSVTRIVTDPPWGDFREVGGGIADLYAGMLKEMCRIVSEDGIVVILTARKELFEDCLKPLPAELRVIAKYNILVSGKKAAVYKLQRIAGGTALSSASPERKRE